MSAVQKEFVEKKTTVIRSVPLEWENDLDSSYKIDFKMCQIKELVWGFQWGKEPGPLPRHTSIVDKPKCVIVLDLSLNEISALEDGVTVFRGLKLLDASLNRIHSYPGIGTLTGLHTLILNNNFITHLEPLLAHCTSLEVIDLAFNKLDNIRQLPAFSKLRVLHLECNQLMSVDGVQGLPQLSELYIQRNHVLDLVPLSASKQLAVLNAGHNGVHSLKSTIETLRGLAKLHTLTLQGNPVDQVPGYNAQLISATTILALDNVSVRSLPKAVHKAGEGPNDRNPNIKNITDAARQAFYDCILERKRYTDELVRFLQNRIMSIQHEFSDWQQMMHQEMDLCTRHLDLLNSDQLINYDPTYIRERLRTPDHMYSWQDPAHIPLGGEWKAKPEKSRRPVPEWGAENDRNYAQEDNIPDYRNIKKPDEVLRLASLELQRKLQQK